MQVETHAFDVQSTSDLESAFETMRSLQVDGLVVFSDQFLNRNRARMIQLANEHRIPAIYPSRDDVTWAARAAESGLRLRSQTSD